MNKPQAIIEAAARRFRYYGIGKTTMQEIAQDVGLAVGTLYLYFVNKDALVVACAEMFVAVHRQQADEILRSELPADEKLRAYVLARYQQAEQTRTGTRHAAEITRAVLRLKPDRILEEGTMMQKVFTQILREGNETGVFAIADVKLSARVFLFALAAFFPLATNEHSTIPAETDLREIVGWFVESWKAGARKRPAKAPARRAARSRKA